ncbi:MAG: hypothetical protein ACOX2A_12240 [Tepidanaerobacteraceae bacterium]
MPKTIEISKTQQYLKDSSDINKDLMTAQFQEQLQTSKQKINKRDETQNVLIEQESSKSQKDRYKGNKQNKKQNKEQKQYSSKKRGNHIDLKI